MKKLLFATIALIILGLIYFNRLELERLLFQAALNVSTSEFFQGSARLKSGSIDRNLKLHLKGIEGTLKSQGGPVPMEIQRIDTTKIVPGLFTPEGINLQFAGIRPKGSNNPGLSGRAELRSGHDWSFKTNTEIEGIDLSEIRWLNPDNLEGSSGWIHGTITAEGSSKDKFPRFTMVVIAQKGGYLQSRFFDVILPYLPELPTKKQMAKLSKKSEVVSFKEAVLRMELASANSMKVFLHISVPEYNVELNINLEIRIDETSSFAELAEVMGLLKGASK